MSVFHGEQSEKVQEKRRYKRRDANVPECSRCETQPPLPGQRYCRTCKNAAARESYHRQKQELKKLRALAERYGLNHLVRARAQCLRCHHRWESLNAQGLAAQHEQKTGHLVEITLTYRSGVGKAARVPKTQEFQFDNRGGDKP